MLKSGRRRAAIQLVIHGVEQALRMRHAATSSGPTRHQLRSWIHQMRQSVIAIAAASRKLKARACNWRPCSIQFTMAMAANDAMIDARNDTSNDAQITIA